MNHRWKAILAACALLAAAGCMPDAVLTEREEATERLRARARELGSKVARMESTRDRLAAVVRSGKTLRNGLSLVEGLRRCGFRVESSELGVLRLTLDTQVSGADGKLHAFATARLGRAASLLRRHLPDHELSVTSNQLGRAVSAVRALNEKAGVPGLRLRATTGGSQPLMVEVRPTQIEALQEVLAATAD